MHLEIERPLRGIIPPLVTPLAGHDQLDEKGFERLIENVISAGCAGVFVLGTTGEAPALSYDLRLAVVRRACEIVRGRIPVLAGISDTSVGEAVRFGNKAAEAGASAAVTTPPYYLRMSQTDLLQHASLLARDVSLPLFLYNIPSMVKLRYEPETVREAAKIPGIVGFKDSSGDLHYLARVLRAVADLPDFTVLIGPEELLPQAMSLGAHGGISGGANLFPELYVSLYKAASAADGEQVRRLQRQVLAISERVYRVGDVDTSYLRGMKCALGLLDICSDLPALPLARFTEAERNAMKAHLEAIAAAMVPA